MVTANALRFFAESYVASLNLGDRILFDQDYAVVKPILHLVGGLLYKRHMRLSLSRDLKGWEVVSTMSDDDAIQGVVIDREPVDHTIKPVAVPMVDNVFSDPDAVTRIQCRACLADWWRCGCRASMTVAKFDEKAPMGRGGQA